MISLIVVCGLATVEIIDLWRKSSLFSTCRARVEMWDNWLSYLLSCPVCLSVWTCLGTVGVYITGLHVQVSHPVLGLIIQAPVLIFGTAKVSNLLHDVTVDIDRTPDFSKLPDLPSEQKDFSNEHHP